MEKGGESQGAADPADDLDARTIFVRSLPFSLTDSQLEDVFSEVGPVRHCFTVKEKGSDQHRGFGFVQFAVAEDAHRAVQEKNGALLQGRKIKVDVAKRRAPLDVRHPKSDLPNPEATTPDHEQSAKSDSVNKESKKRKSTEVQCLPAVKTRDDDLLDSKKKLKAGNAVRTPTQEDQVNKEQKEGKTKKELGSKLQKQKTVDKAGGEKKTHKTKFKAGDRPDQTREDVEPIGSSKQRPARTVVVGGLANPEMLEAVHNEAKKAGTIETIQKTMTELELNSRGLAKDGCKPRAAAIVFLSVKAACQAVALLHQKTIAGDVVWARQLGGEGSKLKQLRLIVRNLPFQVTEATLRDLFSPAGFVWEITIPRKPDGLSKGFAFIGFTSKADAEKAIMLVNGKVVARRPIAVDWAVAKKQYEAAVAPPTPSIAPGADLDESESTASESESDGNDDDDSESDEVSGEKSEEPRVGHAAVEMKPTFDDEKSKVRKRGHDGLVSEKNKEEVSQSKKSGYIVEAGENAQLTTMDRTEEMDMIKKVLTKVVSTVPNHLSDDEEIVEALEIERPIKKKPKPTAVKDLSTEKAASNGKKADIGTEVAGTGPAENELDKEDNKLSRTVFIRNLPPDAKVPELRKLFEEFGEIKSFRLVRHPVTKKSKGNAFLEYGDQEAAQCAVAAAAKNGSEDVGLILKGRAVIVSTAVDKNSARKMAKETFHKQVEDKRNLALSKEGQILIGTPAAEGVSKKDMTKRQQLEHEKATKLRSPNFHVSQKRLSVHNIPKTMSDKELKKLFIDAVKLRASKQNPVIKQVKILRDEDSQKSRGVAFVEFTEHQHALVALRVLNNNPGTFTTEHRPIVEFAIEDSLKLRKRAANAVQAKVKGPQRKRPEGVNNFGDSRKKFDKTQQKIRPAGKTGVPQSEGEDTVGREDRKRKRGKDRREARESSRGGHQTGVQGTAMQDGLQEGPGNGEKQEIKAGRRIKRGKTSGSDRKAAQAERASAKATNEGLQTSGKVKPALNPHKMRKTSRLDRRAAQAERTSAKSTNEGLQTSGKMKPALNPQKMGKKGNKIGEPQPFKKPNLSKNVFPKESRTAKNAAPRQSRVFDRENQVDGKQQRNRRKGRDTEDQLDRLVAEYRTKYFSGVSKPSSSKGSTVVSGDLRRWFE